MKFLKRIVRMWRCENCGSWNGESKNSCGRCGQS